MKTGVGRTTPPVAVVLGLAPAVPEGLIAARHEAQREGSVQRDRNSRRVRGELERSGDRP
jgi:hypothetical protein